ncbi:MAG TPA: phosphopantetheine-binding protein [Gemmatimonadales bacterium]|nr:phosphopantetheine-binding protein [Gemmatimonadales bacterium]
MTTQAAAETAEALVWRILRQELGLFENVRDPEVRLRQDLGADSLDMLYVVMELEQACDAEIDDDTADRFATVADLITWVKTARGEP